MHAHVAGIERRRAFPWHRPQRKNVLWITFLHRNTPSRWRTDGVEIPGWVSKHLGLLLELQRLHAAYLVPPKSDSASD